MPGIGIIANPHSKLNKRSPSEINRLRSIFGQKGIFCLSQTLAELDHILLDYKIKGIDIIGINGGDGSISRVISRTIAIYGDSPLPKFAILGGGTMNLVASELKICGSPSAVLARLVGHLEAGTALKIERLATLKINDIYGFLYADQSSTAILEEFYRNKKSHFRAGWLTLRLVDSFFRQTAFIRSMIKPHDLNASVRPGGQIKTQALGCFAGTIAAFPMGLRLLPFARDRAHHFQITIIDCPAEKLLWYLPLIMLQQKNGSATGRHSFCCQKAELGYNGEIHFTVDGEIYVQDKSSIVIETGPELEFLQI